MEMFQKSNLEKSSSGEVSDLPPGWKPRPPEAWLNPAEIEKSSRSTVSVSSETALYTGKGKEDTETQTLEVPPSYYVIADDTEDFKVESTGVHFRTLDCIEKGHFWKVLLEKENEKLYQDLTDSYNALTREEVENRRNLLAKLLKEEGWKHRLSVLVYTAAANEVERFVPSQWTGARISFDVNAKSDGELFEETLKGIPKGTMYFITADLLHDLARTGNVSHEEISEPERKLLDEIFSLNHIPDAPLDNGGTTEPVPVPLPPTIVLNEGGFSFEGGGPDFWKAGDFLEGEEVDIRDEDIDVYEKAGKALCRTTGDEFDINVCDPTVPEGEYNIYLYSGNRCFQISLSGEKLRAKAACPSEWLMEVKEEGAVVEEVEVFEAPKGVRVNSPRKKKSTAKISVQKFSPRKPFGKDRCQIELDDKENIPPKYFMSRPQQVRAKHGEAQINNDGVYISPQKQKKISARALFTK